MKIYYPIEGLEAKDQYLINEQGTGGFYPIGTNNIWHGGINLTFEEQGQYKGYEDKPIRAIANGKIIAYRITDDYCEFIKKYKEGDKDVTYINKNNSCSNNFVLIKHTIDPTNEQPIVFYSLYMHLLPYGIYDKECKQDKKNQVTIFQEWQTTINTEKDGNGIALKDSSNNRIGTIPCGAYVNEISSPDEIFTPTLSSSRKYRAIEHDVFGKGFVFFKGQNSNGIPYFHQISEGVHKCNYNSDPPLNEDKKGLNLYALGTEISEVMDILPKGKVVKFEKPREAINDQGVPQKTMAGVVDYIHRIERGVQTQTSPDYYDKTVYGYVAVSPETIKTEKNINPILSSDPDKIEVQQDEIDVSAGDIIGWPGYDGTSKCKSFHFEVFTTDRLLNGSDGFWKPKANISPRNSVLKAKRDCGLSKFVSNKAVSTSKKLDSDYFILRQDCLTREDTEKNVWIGIPEKSINEEDLWFDPVSYMEGDTLFWIQEALLDKINILDWALFFDQYGEQNGEFSQDGLCDIKKIEELIPDMDNNGQLDDAEIKKAIAHKSTKHLIRKLVVQHPSEWYYSDQLNDKKWKSRLYKKPPWNMEEDQYNAFLETVKKQSFLNQIDGFTENEKLWHFHPIAFVQHLKRIFDVKTYRFPLAEKPTQNYTDDPRNFSSGRNVVNGQPTRYHAGCDLYAPVGEKIYAVADGVIKRYRNFYWQTYSLEIVHDDFIVRYGEVQPPIGAYDTLQPPNAVSKGLPDNLAEGEKVKRGQHIAYVGQLRKPITVNNVKMRVNYQYSMLHLEMYKDTSRSPLTDLLSPADENPTNQYTEVTAKTFKRRSDLLDPTKFLDEMVTE